MMVLFRREGGAETPCKWCSQAVICDLLQTDVIYLQDKYAVEGWAFINHLSLLLAYLVYTKLRTANLLSKFSIADFLSHLKYIHKIKIQNSWVLSEISGKTQELLDALRLSIA